MFCFKRIINTKLSGDMHLYYLTHWLPRCRVPRPTFPSLIAGLLVGRPRNIRTEIVLHNTRVSVGDDLLADHLPLLHSFTPAWRRTLLPRLSYPQRRTWNIVTPLLRRRLVALNTQLPITGLQSLPSCTSNVAILHSSSTTGRTRCVLVESPSVTSHFSTGLDVLGDAVLVVHADVHVLV